MSHVTNETVIECLKTIKGPDLEGDIVSLGLVSPIMIDGGKVFYNGQRTKSGKTVNIGDMIKLRQGYEEKEIEIIALAERRSDATFAATLYQETTESVKSREKNALARKQGILLSPASEGKPDKKQRRKIRQFKERL